MHGFVKSRPSVVRKQHTLMVPCKRPSLVAQVWWRTGVAKTGILLWAMGTKR